MGGATASKSNWDKLTTLGISMDSNQVIT